MNISFPENTVPLHILAVDDEAGARQSIAFALKTAGHRVALARSGAEALAVVQHTDRPFDLVITDDLMPQMGGVELARKLRAQNFAGQILVISAHVTSEGEQAYRHLGVAGIMGKPYDLGQLQHWLQCVATCSETGPAPGHSCAPGAEDFCFRNADGSMRDG